MEHILSARDISKAYGPVQALKNVSLEVPLGSVFGILGPNGSGKTTLLGIILDVLNADTGTYQWFNGIPDNEARKQIGAILETPNFYHYLSAADNLEIAASIKGKGRENKNNVLEKVGLLQRKDSKFQTYSLGMKQRLSIASALLGNPKVLVLDEPTNGLDPAGIAEIRELIKLLNRNGITVIMASHLLDEVEKVCTHVAILKKGSLLLQGPVNEVLQSDDLIIAGADDLQELEKALTAMPGIKQITVSGKILMLACEPYVTTVHINRYCIDKNIVLSELTMKKKSLETTFMELTLEKK